MNDIVNEQVKQTENYEAAGVGRRLTACLIDLVIGYMFTLASFIFFFSINDKIVTEKIFIQIFIVIFLLLLLFHYFSWHATIGKRVLSIKIVRQDNKNLSLLNAVFVSLAMAVGFFLLCPIFLFMHPYSILYLFVGLLSLLLIHLFISFNKKKRSLIDILCRTKVVKLSEELSKRKLFSTPLFSEEHFGLTKISDNEWELKPPMSFTGLLANFLFKERGLLFNWQKKHLRKYIISEEQKEALYCDNPRGMILVIVIIAFFDNVDLYGYNYPIMIIVIIFMYIEQRRKINFFISNAKIIEGYDEK